jgi:NADH-quinone oxidoreductase subunit G
MATIEIDGKSVEITPGQATIIEVADQMGIEIPRFCYHKKLSVAANCRMCLVEVEKSPKAVPACATPVSDGMKVWTKSAKTRAAQKSVMEFLLINHPLDCPICDQGGECELQDVALEYGNDSSRYTEGKRVVADQNLGPLIATDMTRCIHCTRCIRFGTEIAGLPEMGATGRGEHMRIGTYIEENIEAEVSGNMIDVCPVGALTTKPYRFTARSWELRQSFSVSPHDALGSNISVHTRGGKVMRVVTREAESINETWISDRDRFSYEGLYSQNRLTQPMIKNTQENWDVVTWSAALSAVAERSADLLRQSGGETFKTWVSPSTSLEEGYLLQQVLKGLGASPFEHRLRQQDFRAPESIDPNTAPRPSLSMPIAEIKDQSVLFLIGCQIHIEHPILALRIRQAAMAETTVFALNPFQVDIRFPVKQHWVPERGDLCGALSGFAKAVLEKSNPKTKNIPQNAGRWLADIRPTPEQMKMAEIWCAAPKSLIVLGALAIEHPEYSRLLSLVHLIAHISGARIALLPVGANALGLSLLLENTQTAENTATQSYSIESDARVHVLWGIDPALDSVQAASLLSALASADCVIAATAFRSTTLDRLAHIYLPIAPFYESGGTFINMEGRAQTVKPAAHPEGDVKPGWKVLRVVNNLWGLPDLGFETLAAVSDAAKAQIKTQISDINSPCPSINIDAWHCPKAAPAAVQPSGCVHIAPLASYRTDFLSREAEALQKTNASAPPVARLHPDTVKQHHLSADARIRITALRTPDANLSCTYRSDPKVPKGSLVLNAGFDHSALLMPYDILTIEGIA